MRFFAFLFLILFAVPAQAQLNIVATVNDDVITAFDVEGRLRLSLLSSRLPDTPDVRQKLMPQVIKQLVDEQLKLRTVKDFNVQANERDIQFALSQVAQQNNVPIDQLKNYFEKMNIPFSTLINQIQADFAWRDYIKLKYRFESKVGEDEIDDMLEQIKLNQSAPQYLLSEIFLYVDDAEQEKAAEMFGRRVVQQILEGAPLGAFAQQFSQSPTASSGGQMGWMRADQLDKNVGDIVGYMKPGQVSWPIKVENGFQIIQLHQMQDRKNQALPDREEISELLTRQKLGKLSQRLLRDLRQAAIIDVKM